MKTMMMAVSLAAMATLPAAAQDAGIANPRGMVANFDAVNLGQVLTDLGIVWQERQTADGKPYIAASVGNQFSFNIIPAACLGAANNGCVGVNFLALFNGATPNAQSVSAFNQKYFFTSAGALPGGGGAYISRYEIADYGIPRGNVASSLATFVYLASQFRNEISSGSQTVSADGFAEDMSARYLNRVSAEAAGVDAAETEEGLGAVHLEGFEEAPAIVRIMMSTPGATKNKIENVGAKR